MGGLAASRRVLTLILVHFSPLAEFSRIAIATGVGFLIMGFIGFVVKLIHIPINQILLSQ